MNEISLIFDAITLDNPLIFYIESFKLASDLSSGKCLFYPVYKYSRGFIKENTKRIKEYLQVFDVAKSKSDIEKEYFVHDYCLKHFKYDYTFGEEAFTPLGLVLNGTAVCEGIAKFTKLALNYLGVKSLVVSGKGKNPEHERSEGHAWNIVMINDKTYHLDVTFDLTISEKINRYDYFNLCDDDIKKDHSFGGNVPKCETKGGDYFTTNSLLARNPTELETIIKNKLKRGEKSILVKLENVKNVNKITDKVLDIAQKEQGKRVAGILFGGSLSVISNIAQYVFEINFK
jgi:hypothetical protein